MRGRRPPAELAETLEFPEAVGNELTLRRALGGARRAGCSHDRSAASGSPRKVALCGAPRRRRLVAPDADVARADRRRRPPPRRARAEAARSSRRRSLDADGSRRSSLTESTGQPARARPPEGDELREHAPRRAAPGAREHRVGLRLHRRGGRAVVAHSRAARAARSAGRLNQPRPALVEAHVDGTPRKVNRRAVALVREEWRVVDRWWTEEPVNRRYFDVVLDERRARGRLPRRGGGPLVQPARGVTGSAVRAQALEEAAGRCVEVEETDRLVVREHGTRGRSPARPRRTCPARRRAARLDPELDLAVEHVEAVRVVGVRVRVDALEARGERSCRSALSCGKIAENPVRTRTRVRAFPRRPRSREHRLFERAPAVGRRVVLVEAGPRRVRAGRRRSRQGAWMLRNPAVASLALREPVDDVRRRGDERARGRADRLCSGRA